MATQEERLQTLEYGLAQFKTETIKAYQDVAMELTIIKGLTDNGINRLTLLKRDMDQQFANVKQDIGELDIKVDRLEQRYTAQESKLDNLSQRFTTLEGKFDQVLQMLATLTKK